MTRKYAPHVLGLGILLLAIYSFNGLEGSCSPWDVLRCDQLKLDGSILTLSGTMKSTIEAVNFGKNNPSVYIESGGDKSYMTCSKTANFASSKLGITLQCSGQLENMQKGQSLVMEWKIETSQPYSEQALYEEEEVAAISGGGKRTCSKVGEKLVCEVNLIAKIPAK